MAIMDESSDYSFEECYRLERKLMSGSYGTVYVGMGVDDYKDMRYAVKVVDRR